MMKVASCFRSLCCSWGREGKGVSIRKIVSDKVEAGFAFSGA